MKMGQRRAVFLDRDGVLNRAIVKDGIPHPPASLEELEILPGAHDALEELRRADFVLIGVTNQPDVSRGTQSREVVEQINAKLLASLPLQEIAVCYHDDKDRCDCRKPQPGLLVQTANRYGVDLSSSFVIGDRWKDNEAGHRAGCKTVFIDYGYLEKYFGRAPDHIAHSLHDGVAWILGKSDVGGGSA